MIIENTAEFPDASTLIRTHPLTYPSDQESPLGSHAWHQLTYAVRGHLEVQSEGARVLIPPGCALWVPAHVVHMEKMRAPVSVRTLYLAPGALPSAWTDPRTLAVPPLLRELILHITQLGALDERHDKQSRLIGVIVDLILDMSEVPLRLPIPTEPLARRVADIIEQSPGGRSSIAQIAGRAGTSLRSVERCFRDDVGMPVGEWRRRFRMFRAMELLQAGASVTETAFDVGYGSVSAFSQAYRSQFGVSPSRR